MVAVMRFEKYDIGTDQIIRSKRYATPDAIRRHGLVALGDTQIDIDGAYLDSEGMTEIGFVPQSESKPAGFQSQVLRDQKPY